MFFVSAFIFLISISKLNASDEFENGSTLSRSRRAIPEGLSVPELIRFWGYVCEEHFVTTRDGYRIGIHRIPRGRDEPETTTNSSLKSVVLLGHGIISSSSAWTFGPPDKSLGYVLADAGYDVWMVNNRGTPASRNHTVLCSEATCREFWDFGWHEIAIYDYPVTIDYVLKATKQEDLYFIGHSMGGTQYLVLLSELPQYNSKIRAGFLLAPAAFMAHSTSNMFRVSKVAETLERVFHFFGQFEFKPHHKSLAWLGHNVCNIEKRPLIGDVCANAAATIMSLHQEQINKTMGPVYMDHYPAGSSTRAFVHFAQIYNNKGDFVKYDFGDPAENWINYGQITPPPYNLKRVTAKTAIFIGEADDLATLPDAKHLATLLPNVFHFEKLKFPGCNHLDFLIAIDSRRIIYDPIVKMLGEMESERRRPNATLSYKKP